MRQPCALAALSSGVSTGLVTTSATIAWRGRRAGSKGMRSSPFMPTGLAFTARSTAPRSSTVPAEIGRVSNHGRPIEVGEPANLTLFDPDVEWVVQASDMVSRSRNTPYAGMVLHGKVLGTWLRGRATVLDGVVVEFETV